MPELVLAALAVLLVLGVVASYNRLVALRSRVDAAWAGVDADLARRADLLDRVGTDGAGPALERELELAEDRLVASRRFLDGNLRAYHARLASFPTNLLAPRLGFTPEDPGPGLP